MELHTRRLRLRPWRCADREAFARLNADAEVMRYFVSPLSREDSDVQADRIQAHIEEHGWGLWAVEIVGVTPFAGFIGLAVPRFEAHFTPSTEIGWRLGTPYWRQGYATEGANAALDFGFQTLALHEIVSLTAESNAPSRRVMERIGMTRDPADDFNHPLLPDGHALKPHVLYRRRKTL